MKESRDMRAEGWARGLLLPTQASASPRPGQGILDFA